MSKAFEVAIILKRYDISFNLHNEITFNRNILEKLNSSNRRINDKSHHHVRSTHYSFHSWAWRFTRSPRINLPTRNKPHRCTGFIKMVFVSRPFPSSKCMHTYLRLGVVLLGYLLHALPYRTYSLRVYRLYCLPPR